MSARTHRKRSTSKEKRHTLDDQIGVGARQIETDPSTGGGEYLLNCISSELSDLKKIAPRLKLDELREMKLPAPLLELAEEIGVENFIVTWRLLDSYAEKTNNGSLRLHVPGFGRFLRYQRNEFIKSKAASGCKLEEIRTELMKLGMSVSYVQVQRVAKQRCPSRENSNNLFESLNRQTS